MKFSLSIFASILILSSPIPARCSDALMSEDTQDCLGCHEYSHPGIVENWRTSGHAHKPL